nr:hypothetical protein [Thiolapillus sp.]
MPQTSWSPSATQQLRKLVAAPYLPPNDWTPRSDAYFVFPLAQGTPGKQCGLAATGVYQPSLRSPWLAAAVSESCKGSITSRIGFDRLNLGVQPFSHSITDSVFEIGQNIRQMVLDHFRLFLDRCQATAYGPGIPAVEMPFGPARIAVIPETTKHLLDGPGTSNFQV